MNAHTILSLLVELPTATTVTREEEPARQLDSKTYKNQKDDIKNMAKATEQHHSMRALLAGLIIVILSFHILFVGSLIQSANQSQRIAIDWKEKGFQETENAKSPAETSDRVETVGDQETIGNTEAYGFGENPSQIDQGHGHIARSGHPG